MRKLEYLAFALAVFLAGSAFAADVSPNFNRGPVGGTSELGSVNGTNPYVVRDLTTGFYSSGAGKVDVAILGTKLVEWGTALESFFGSITATGPISAGVQTVAVSGAAIATDYSKGSKLYATLANSATTTISNPTNPVDGGKLLYALTQGTSSVTAWGSAFDFGASGAPTLSSVAGKVDYVGFNYDANLTKWVYIGNALGN